MSRHFSKEETQMANKHEKMLNITNLQGNANQNHNEIPLHTQGVARIKKEDKNKYW